MLGFIVTTALTILTVIVLYNPKFRKGHREGEPVCVFLIAALATGCGVSWSISCDRGVRDKAEKVAVIRMLQAADQDLRAIAFDLARYVVATHDNPPELSVTFSSDSLEAFGKRGRLVDRVLESPEYLTDVVLSIRRH